MTAVLDVSAVGLMVQAADTLDVYVDSSLDGGTTWFNIGRFKRITGVDSAYATGTLTSTGALTAGSHAESVVTANTILDGDTTTVGAITYRFKTVMAQAYDVALGANDAAALDNLKAAINGTGTEGVEYFAGTVAHPDVVATTNADTTQKIVARVPGTAANTLATTSSGATLAWADTTLGGGTGASNPGVAAETVTVGAKTYAFVDALSETSGAAAIVNQVLYGGSVATAFANLKKAVNAEAGAGTNYSTGTTANADATVTATDATTVSVRAAAIGTPGNSVATTATTANAAFGAVTLTGGTFGPGVAARQSLTWTPSVVETNPVDLISDLSNTNGGIRQIGFGDMIRYRGVVAGATADFTYSVYAVAKA